MLCDPIRRAMDIDGRRPTRSFVARSLAALTTDSISGADRAYNRCRVQIALRSPQVALLGFSILASLLACELSQLFQPYFSSEYNTFERPLLAPPFSLILSRTRRN